MAYLVHSLIPHRCTASHGHFKAIKLICHAIALGDPEPDGRNSELIRWPILPMIPNESVKVELLHPVGGTAQIERIYRVEVNTGNVCHWEMRDGAELEISVFALGFVTLSNLHCAHAACN